MNKKIIILHTTILAILVCVCSIFCCFGEALSTTQTSMLSSEPVSGGIKNVFNFMFGGVGAMSSPFMAPDVIVIVPIDITITPILTVVFVLHILIVIAGMFAIVNIFRKKDNKLFFIVIAALATIVAILALCSKDPMVNAQPPMDSDPTAGEITFGLGSGVIAYAVVNFVGAAGCVVSYFLNKKSA